MLSKALKSKMLEDTLEEDTHSSSSGMGSLTPLTIVHDTESSSFFHNSAHVTTSPKVNKPVASQEAKSGKSTNQQVVVPHHSGFNTPSKSKQPESSSIQSKGVLLDRFRELWDPSVEEETATTGGSICSIDDYHFQLHDFELAHEEISASGLSADQPLEYMSLYSLPIEWVRKPPQVEGEYCQAAAGGFTSPASTSANPSIEEKTSITGGSICSVADYLFQLEDFELAFEDTSASGVSVDQPLEYCKSVHSSPIEWFSKHPQIEDEHCQAAAGGFTSSASTSAIPSVEQTSIIGRSICSVADYLFQLEDFELAFEDKSASGVSVDQPLEYMSVYSQPMEWIRKPPQVKDDHCQAAAGGFTSSASTPAIPSVEEQTSIIGGSICSVAEYLFQLEDFELAFEEASVSGVSADQPLEYGVSVHSSPIELVRKPPQVNDHCRGAAVGLRSSTSTPTPAKCEDERKSSKFALENASSFTAVLPITEPKVKPNSSDTDSKFLFGCLVPSSTSCSPGALTSSSSIDKSAHRTSKSSSCTLTTSESDMQPKRESRAIQDYSAVATNETAEKPFSGTLFWEGAINSKEFGKTNVKAFEVISSKLIPNLNIPSTLELIGRVRPKMIWDYLLQTRRAGTREIVLLVFLPASEFSREVYSSFIRHMLDKERIAVVGPFSILIKDFYLVPLPKDSPVPPALCSFSPGIQLFQNRTSDLLLGVIISSNKRQTD